MIKISLYLVLVNHGLVIVKSWRLW